MTLESIVDLLLGDVPNLEGRKLNLLSIRLENDDGGDKNRQHEAPRPHPQLRTVFRPG